MMIIEGIFYGLDALFYEIGISLIILFYVYMGAMDTRIDAFEIPGLNITICVISIYTVIYVAINHAKRKLQKENIIDEIKEENI